MDKIAYLHPGAWPVHIGFTTNEAAFQREMNRLKVKQPPRFLQHERAAMTMHTLVYESNVTFIIAASKQPKHISKEQYAALVAHEALHVIQEMRAELNQGEPFDRETESYLLQYIVQHCLQEAWATKRNRRVEP